MTESRQFNLKRTAFLVLKLGIVGLALWYIYHKVTRDGDLGDAIGLTMVVANDPQQLLYGLAALLLMPFNWAIESFKWRYLIRKLDALSFTQAIKAVLAGLTMSTFTPNRIGELAGRALFLSPGNRVKGTLVTAIGTTSQLLITIIPGSIAVLLTARQFELFGLPNDGIAWYGLFALTMAASIGLVYLYLKTAVLARLLDRVSWLQKLEQYYAAFGQYRPAELANVLRMSLLRYAVFSFQFYLLLQMFGVSLEVEQAMALIPVSFLVMTIIPTIGLTEVGVREVVAMEVIGLATDHHVGIVAATFVLWIFNWMVPAIAGSIFMVGVKLQKAT